MSPERSPCVTSIWALSLSTRTWKHLANGAELSTGGLLPSGGMAYMGGLTDTHGLVDYREPAGLRVSERVELIETAGGQSRLVNQYSLSLSSFGSTEAQLRNRQVYGIANEPTALVIWDMDTRRHGATCRWGAPAGTMRRRGSGGGAAAGLAGCRLGDSSVPAPR